MEELKDRLIIAGIREIETHGLTDFSLRRVATACGASCAAPYKHFDGKDEFVLEILRFINRQWDLLEQQLVTLYGADARRLLEELCVANIRFRVANPRFGAVMMVSAKDLDEKQKEALAHPLNRVAKLLSQLYEQDAVVQKEYQLRSLVYGGVQMIGNGELPNTDETIQMIRKTIRLVLN